MDQITVAAADGAAINVVTLGELVAGRREGGQTLQSELRAFDIQIMDLPSASGPVGGSAYRKYTALRRLSGGGIAPRVPLPDFFIGAHAQVMGWKLATRDIERYALYFPAVTLIHP